jgi:hypothetical protein
MYSTHPNRKRESKAEPIQNFIVKMRTEAQSKPLVKQRPVQLPAMCAGRENTGCAMEVHQVIIKQSFTNVWKS